MGAFFPFHLSCLLRGRHLANGCPSSKHEVWKWRKNSRVRQGEGLAI